MANVVYDGRKKTLKALKEMTPGTRIRVYSCGLSHEGYFQQLNIDRLIILEDGINARSDGNGSSKIDITYGHVQIMVVDESQNKKERDVEEPPRELHF